MNKQQMINELRDMADFLECSVYDNQVDTLRKIADDLQFKEKSILNSIVEWNKERLLDKQRFEPSVEIKHILEELIEMKDIESEKARNQANFIYDTYFKDKVSVNKEILADAYADIIVFATGSLLKLGYDPECVMKEVIKEISSRIGKIIDGKFVKDKSPEAQAKWYKADFSKCERR